MKPDTSKHTFTCRWATKIESCSKLPLIGGVLLICRDAVGVFCSPIWLGYSHRVLLVSYNLLHNQWLIWALHQAYLMSRVHRHTAGWKIRVDEPSKVNGFQTHAVKEYPCTEAWSEPSAIVLDSTLLLVLGGNVEKIALYQCNLSPINSLTGLLFLLGKKKH